ncbi:nuclear transport factor 2 family protein [Micromonospora sp. SL4-19]|uniref:nuclear transport factor 2 family protein n=1 Tax=Micromonospora sp. SL4-19 TaxID=3399129 RepID=UPI003A4E5172
MTDSTTTEILELGRRWAEAEQRADVETLEALTVADFALVGPLGFVLDKQQWPDRYRTGDLITASLTWDEVAVRSYDDAAVASDGTPSRPVTVGSRRTGSSVRCTSPSAWAIGGSSPAFSSARSVLSGPRQDSDAGRSATAWVTSRASCAVATACSSPTPRRAVATSRSTGPSPCST